VSAESDGYKAVVISVTDGDTLKVDHLGEIETIRLVNIDCPERTQAFGDRAKEMTSSLCLQKEVTIISTKRDRYKRRLASLILSDGRCVNNELVKTGFAWWYQKYDPDDRVLENLECEARKLRRGLWKDASPVSLWEFRATKEAVHRHRSEVLMLH
jgi:endonuclease YncB( thermonuclease family)